MRFIYGYKTHDNEMREGEICASSRDAVYRELKQKGIKPFKVVLAPGFGNWLASLGKRTYAIVALSLALTVTLAVIIHFSLFTFHSDVSAQPRHQIYGDPALMGEFERTNFAAVFDDPGLRYLAHYAEPGELVGKDVRAGNLGYDVPAALAASVDAPVAFVEGEARECRELKRIILTMQAELKRYLANGIGTPERFMRRLNERQDREAQIYFTAKHDLEKEKSPERWAQINASLRAIGLKAIPPPAEPEEEIRVKR